MQTTPAFKKVLFLCTGNYYRSRFAEWVFNARATEAGISWRADSRGLDVKGQGSGNIGPISKHTLAGLGRCGIALEAQHRFPLQVQEADLAGSDLIVALKEAEHRELLRGVFTDWEDRVEYWDIHDLDLAPSESALPQIEERVNQLIDRLRII